MFTTAQKSDSSQISITGVRALVIIGLLLFKSQSLTEIKETLIKYKIIDETIKVRPKELVFEDNILNKDNIYLTIYCSMLIKIILGL